MYYTITNAIGTEVKVDGKTLVCGNLYANKTKAPKDADYLLAFSDTQTVDSAGKKLWRFDGKADIDAEMFVEEVDEETRDILAWKSERINIQAKIRPSKDSKKAIESAERQDKFAELNAQMAAGEITIEQFAEKTRQIIASM